MQQIHRYVASAIALLLVQVVCATHIIGGDMYYDDLGNNQYRITLRLYRDCGPDNTNGTGFDLSAQFAVYNSAGDLITSIAVSDPGETIVPVELNDPCLTAPPEVCVATTEYIQIFTLPPIAGGYTVSYQRCCRTPAMANLQGQQGITCTVDIPGPPNSANSSPRFNDYPPIALCLGQDMSFDHSASDPDGDQLVYQLCAPYQGADALNPAPLAPAPPYQEVTFGPTYSAADPINSTPPLAIDPATGLLTVHPTLQGTFTVGVCVSEFRNGQLIGTARRDFMFRVVPCDATVLAVIAAQGAGEACSLSQEFINQSVNGQTWAWDFGDPSTTSDVSSAQSPSYTYPAPGSYSVTLIVNPGAACADTSVSIYVVAPSLQPTFVVPGPMCGEQEVTLTLAGNTGNNPVINWSLGAGATPSSATTPEVTALFAAIGTQPVTVTVEELGCSGTFTANVQVHPQPTAAFAEQAEFCASLTHQFQNESTDAGAFSWHFGDPSTSADNSTANSPEWTYGAQGFHTISLIATSGPVCADTATRVFDVHIAPAVFFYRPPIRCPGEVALLNAVGSTSASPIIAWDLGSAGSPNTSTSAHVNGFFFEEGAFAVTLTMTEFGCTASYTDSVIVYPRPTVDFFNGSQACVGEIFPFTSVVTAATPVTLHWSLGDGATSSDTALTHQYEDPGTYTVSLSATTSMGCIATVTRTHPGAVEVYPNPVAAFTALPGEVDLMDPRITVEDYSSLAVEWTYTVEGREVHEPRFEHVFADAGQYVITQKVLTENGCADSTSRMVVVSGHFFWAPTAFTPDGDGRNEVWLPIVTGAREYELVIFDRWGHEVFRTNDTKAAWNGDGYTQSTFVYTARIKEWGAYAKEYGGHFTLLK